MKISKSTPLLPRAASAPIPLSTWVFSFLFVFAPGMLLTFLHSQLYGFQGVFIFSPDS